MGGCGLGGQGRCEQTIEVFVKNQKMGGGLGRGGGSSRGVGLGAQGRCEQRSEVLVKIQKKKMGGGGGRVRGVGFWGSG